MAEKRVGNSIVCFLQIHYKGGKITHFMRKRKQAILYIINKTDHKKVDHYYIKVSYYPGIFNDGFYYTKKEAKEAFSTFSSLSEQNFVQKYWRGQDLTKIGVS